MPVPASTIPTLTDPLTVIPGIGDARADAFRRIGIRCIADLLTHLPHRYEHEREELTIAAADKIVGRAHGATAHITVKGEIATARPVFGGRRSRHEATLQDESGALRLVWFNSPWLRGKLVPGLEIRVWGRAKRHGDYLEIANAKWEPLEHEQEDAPREERFRPIYPAGDELKSPDIEKAIAAILEPALALIDDHLPASYRKKRELPLLANAYRMVHRPSDLAEAEDGRRRLVFDELLMLQLGVMLKRRHRRETLSAPKLRFSDAIDAHIRERLPFTLTDAQDRVISEIVEDVITGTPMNRLLQGDVGAGKTVVAAYAMLLAVAAGQQAALMAPTELLAEQHAQSFDAMLANSDVCIDVLTGSLKPKARENLLERVAEGEVDLLIGTHALLTKGVKFKGLALAVIDEQHRFGVHQRAALRAKANDPNSAPHVLVMTATPIPRTLAISVYGDLDLSVIDALPPGRQSIITKVVTPQKAHEVYDYVATRIAAGEQAYVVLPAIEVSESGFKDVMTHMEYLQKGPLRDATLAALHGRIDREERETIMQRFRAGLIDALVATTVIEVGVDVPNACIMVIEQADRFGLAQLHQLRGRVGRGAKRSLCVLIAEPVTEDGAARIEAIRTSDDGFAIAEKDLEIRGPGELFGARQSGTAPFRAASLPRDAKLLAMARRDADKWIKQHPHLEGDEHLLLRRRLLKAHGESLGLGDVG